MNVLGLNPIGFIWTTFVCIVMLSVSFFYSKPLSLDCLMPLSSVAYSFACNAIACCSFCLLPAMPLPVCLLLLFFLPTACSSACYTYSSASIPWAYCLILCLLCLSLFACCLFFLPTCLLPVPLPAMLLFLCLYSLAYCLFLCWLPIPLPVCLFNCLLPVPLPALRIPLPFS